MSDITEPAPSKEKLGRAWRSCGWILVASHDNPLTNSAVPDCWIHDEYEVAWSEEEAMVITLSETQEKLKKAEKAHDQLTERYKTTHDHWIAAEERWKQVQQTLILVQGEYAEKESALRDEIDSLRSKLQAAKE